MKKWILKREMMLLGVPFYSTWIWPGGCFHKLDWSGSALPPDETRFFLPACKLFCVCFCAVASLIAFFAGDWRLASRSRKAQPTTRRVQEKNFKTKKFIQEQCREGHVRQGTEKIRAQTRSGRGAAAAAPLEVQELSGVQERAVRQEVDVWRGRWSRLAQSPPFFHRNQGSTILKIILQALKGRFQIGKALRGRFQVGVW